MLLKCLLYQSSNYNHLWGNGFLRFNNLLLSYLISFYLHVWSSPHRGYCTPSSALHIQEFAVGICCGYLLLVFISKSFFEYVSKSCLYEENRLCMWAKLFHLWYFLYCRNNFGPLGISVDCFPFFFTKNFNSHHKTQKKNKLSPFQ